jgi:MoaA/NifB/PqqE/SkfB family radical SAM enzyme
MIEPMPTTRAVIDPSRRCGLRCRMCYYLHSDLKSVQPWESVKQQIDQAVARGNTCADVTGGEPMLYPDIHRLVRHAHKVGLSLRIITSLIASERRYREAVQDGIRNWLVSMHGLEATHDTIVQYNGARRLQEKRLDLILSLVEHPVTKDEMTTLDFNCVISRYNQGELAAFAEYLLQWRPRIVNFISFNPHHEWRNHEGTLDLVADLNVVEPQLNEAMLILEEHGCGVNVRYYPMCRIATEYRRCVCNDLHVVFDSGEWDYDIQPKTFAAFREWGIKTSRGVEEKGPPCDGCDLQQICGGANKFWHAASSKRYGERLVAHRGTMVAPNDFYHYRQFNANGMA